MDGGGEAGGQLEQLVSTPQVWVCRIDQLIVQAWFGESRLHDMDLVDAAFNDMIARFPAGFCSLALLRMSELRSSPDAEIRERSRQRFRNNDPYTIAAACVFDSPGIVGKTLRVFLRAVIMTARVETPVKVCGSLDAAFEWIVSVEGVEPRLVAERDRIQTMIQRWWDAGPPARAPRPGPE